MRTRTRVHCDTLFGEKLGSGQDFSCSKMTLSLWTRTVCDVFKELNDSPDVASIFSQSLFRMHLFKTSGGTALATKYKIQQFSIANIYAWFIQAHVSLFYCWLQSNKLLLMSSDLHSSLKLWKQLLIPLSSFVYHNPERFFSYNPQFLIIWTKGIRNIPSSCVCPTLVMVYC